jgi:hypothetical protein
MSELIERLRPVADIVIRYDQRKAEIDRLAEEELAALGFTSAPVPLATPALSLPATTPEEAEEAVVPELVHEPAPAMSEPEPANVGVSVGVEAPPVAAPAPVKRGRRPKGSPPQRKTCLGCGKAVGPQAERCKSCANKHRFSLRAAMLHPTPSDPPLETAPVKAADAWAKPSAPTPKPKEVTTVRQEAIQKAEATVADDLDALRAEEESAQLEYAEQRGFDLWFEVVDGKKLYFALSVNSRADRTCTPITRHCLDSRGRWSQIPLTWSMLNRVAALGAQHLGQVPGAAE